MRVSAAAHRDRLAGSKWSRNKRSHDADAIFNRSYAESPAVTDRGWSLTPTVGSVILKASNPNVTDWLQAVGGIVSALGVVVALLLLWHEVRKSREERAEREAERLHAAAAQARQLVLKVTKTFATLPERIPQVRCEITNHSRDPIHGVRATIRHTSDATPRINSAWHILRPDEAVELQWTAPRDPAARLPEYELHDFTVEASFVDASGLGWLRKDLEPPIRLYELDLTSYDDRDPRTS